MRCHSARRAAMGICTLSMPSRFVPRRMNGSTVVASGTPPVRPLAATDAPYRSVRSTWARVAPPTQSTAPAQRSFSSGRPASGVSSLRSITSAAPSERSQSASSSLPVLATTSCPSAASMPMAIEPTPPDAPVTSTGPSPGSNPCCCSAATDIAAVNPAVPTSMAVRGSSPSGMATTQAPGTRASSAYPP